MWPFINFKDLPNHNDVRLIQDGNGEYKIQRYHSDYFLDHQWRDIDECGSTTDFNVAKALLKEYRDYYEFKRKSQEYKVMDV